MQRARGRENDQTNGWQGGEVDCSTSIVLFLGPVLRLYASEYVRLERWGTLQDIDAVVRRTLDWHEPVARPRIDAGPWLQSDETHRSRQPQDE